MKQRLIQTIIQGDNTLGQVSDKNDLMKAQQFMHARISETIYDFLNNQNANEATGFSYELGEGNAFNITIKKPGRVYANSGVSFELLGNTLLSIAEADEEFPRLDLVVAVLDDEVNAELDLIPFVQLRTAEEFSESVEPYPPQNINAATELHWRAVPQIRTGTPAATPSAPALASNEVPLYLIAVAAGASQIHDTDVFDVRETILTLRKINQLVGKNTIDIAGLLRRIEIVEDVGNLFINLPLIFGQFRTLNDILSSLQRQLASVRNLPEIRYKHPKLALTDHATAQIPAAGAVTDDVIAVPVVDIEVGGVINFGDREVILRPEKFADATRNARFHQVTSNPETVKLETVLTLNGVEQIAADGAADFVEKASEFPADRARPACAARNGQFIEVFGGLASNNLAHLGDWLTYDVDNDTLTTRVPLTALPSADRPAMFPCGDGTNVLLICGSESDDTPQIFKLDAVSGAVTEITTTKPTGVQFFGDLIATNKILVVAIRKEISGFETDFWEFNTSTNLFTQLGVTGSVPSLTLDYAHGCFYRENEFVLVKFTPGESASGRTYIFNASSLVWTQINIASPYGNTAEKRAPLSRFRMANINGRPLLVGGLLAKETDPNNARIWELQSNEITFSTAKRIWNAWNATFEPLTDAGLCSTLIGNRPAGRAALFAGHGKFSNAQRKVFASVQGGLVATTYNGEAAITLADTSTFATFSIPIYNNAWEVASYMLSVVGDWTDSNLKVEVSFDDGDNYQTISPDRLALVLASDSPGKRRLKITLYNLKSSKPVLQQLVEIFDEDGAQLEQRIVIRYDSPGAVRAVYVDRDGVITLSATIEPSTPDKCLLHKVTPDGAEDPPIVKNYINRRRVHIKYTGISDGSAEFDNELAVPVRYVDARAVKDADSVIYKIGDPEVEFDAVVDVAGVVSGDAWIVELEG